MQSIKCSVAMYVAGHVHSQSLSQFSIMICLYSQFVRYFAYYVHEPISTIRHIDICFSLQFHFCLNFTFVCSNYRYYILFVYLVNIFAIVCVSVCHCTFMSGYL